jgi:hypothetical protein
MHDYQTARYAGLAGLNGELLIAAETAKFDVFITVDQGIEYQQNLTGRNIAIIIFRTKSNRLKDLLPHARARLPRLLNPCNLVRLLESRVRSATAVPKCLGHIKGGCNPGCNPHC